MTSKTLLIAVFILSCNLLVSAQTASPEAGEAKTLQNQEKVVAYLKTVGREAGSLNMPENRVRYLTETADLLWRHDEKTARVLFANALDSFRTIMQSLDAAYQQRISEEADDSSSFFGRGTDKSHFYQANTFRRNLLTALAKRDPQAAHDFFRETQRENFKEFGWNEGDLEARLVAQIAKNDSARALALGQQKLAKNEFEGLGTLALDLYSKDAEKGAKLAAEIAAKISDVKPQENNSAMWSSALQLFNKGAEIQEKDTANKTPLLSKSELTELAQTIIKAMSLSNNNGNSYIWYSNSQLNQINLKKYSPAAYAALERQVQEAAAKIAAEFDEGDTIAVEEMPPATAAGGGTGAGSQRKNTDAPRIEPYSEPAAKQLDEVSIEEIRKKLGEVRGRNQRFYAAAQAIKMLSDRGQKEKAKLLLPEITALQVAQPRKGMEMIQNLMFADAAAGVEPERAFAALEATIYGFNEVATSILRIGEFLDAREMAGEGEFNMAGFTKEFFRTDSSDGAANFTRMFMHLSATDFDRTTALAEKFDRLELRLEAKMMIIRSIIPPENR